MADLEKLAVKRDRGYLVRLALGLVLAGIAGSFIFRGLTGQGASGCMADAFLGGDAESEPREP